MPSLASWPSLSNSERLCCPWLVFHLTFQPEEGPISLEMGDSAETKEMVYLVMETRTNSTSAPFDRSCCAGHLKMGPLNSGVRKRRS